ncbi:AtpZ/AtpI family protein [Pseudaeromonas sp. ZJS20]|uniref:AtpZ/AtpI family protein n=1 Tax=Pseudaeromonas aegiceratis TaxID=3153928 RepID=UPI00390C5EFB
MAEGKDPGRAFSHQLRRKVARKRRAQGQPTRTLWAGLGMMGLVGWSVALPTLLGAALGLWLDAHYPGGRSWTLALLVAGLLLGCVNAWHWLAKEEREIRKQEQDDDE